MAVDSEVQVGKPQVLWSAFELCSQRIGDESSVKPERQQVHLQRVYAHARLRAVQVSYGPKCACNSIGFV